MDLGALRRLVDERRGNDGHQTWGYHSRVVESHKVVCVTPPKNGCTATKRVLLSLDDPSWRSLGSDRLGEVHDAGVPLQGFETARVCEMLTSNDWLRFTFVRNPYDRLFSAYKSKIGNTWDRQYDWLRADIRDAFDYPGIDPESAEKPTLVSFADYVRYITETDDPRVLFDGHIDQQANILACDVISYDRIGRFERFQEDFLTVLERIDASTLVRQLVADRLNPTVSVPLPYVYDKELAHRAFGRYAVDFDMFGYGRESWRLA